MANKRQRAAREIKYGDAKKRAETHESGGVRTAYKVPDGMKLYTVSEPCTAKLDIMPYVVGKGNPCEPEGNVWYERTFYVHKSVGPESRPYCCPARTAGKKCPICEDLQKMRRSSDPDKELIDSLAVKERQLFLVIDKDSPQEGVQLFDCSYFGFGATLDETIKSGDDEDKFENFFYLEGGKSLKVTFKKNKKFNNFFPASVITFRDRSKDLPEDTLDKMPCLDDLLIIHPYDKLKAIYEMAEAEDDEDKDDDEPKKKPKAGKKPAAKEEDDDEDADESGDEDDEGGDDEAEDDDDDKNPADAAGLTVGCSVDHGDHGECTVTKISTDGTSLTLKDEDGKVHKAIAVDEVELIDEDDSEDDDEPEEKKPAPKKGGKKKPADEDEEEEEEPEEDDDDAGWDDDDEPEEEDEDEDPPAKKPRGRPKKK